MSTEKIRLFRLKIGIRKGFTEYVEQNFYPSSLDQYKIMEINRSAERYKNGDELAFAPLATAHRAVNTMINDDDHLFKTGNKTVDKLQKLSNNMDYNSLKQAIEAARAGKVIISLKDFCKIWVDYNIKKITPQPREYVL